MANHTYIGRSLGRAIRAPLFNHEIVFVDDCCIFHAIYHIESSIPMYSISCLLFPSQAHLNTTGKPIPKVLVRWNYLIAAVSTGEIVAQWQFKVDGPRL